MALDVAFSGEQRGLAAVAQAFDLLPLFGIDPDGSDIALALMGTARAAKRGLRAGKAS